MSEQHSQREKDFLIAYDEYSDALFRFAMLKTGDHEKALDVVQTTFMRVWRHIKSDRPITHMRGFLYRIARNVIIDEHRRKQSHSLETIEAEIGIIADDTDHFEQTVVQFDIEQIQRFVDAMPENYREVIVLRFLEDCSLEEISVALNISKNNLSVRIHRALAYLQNLIATEETYVETQRTTQD